MGIRFAKILALCCNLGSNVYVPENMSNKEFYYWTCVFCVEFAFCSVCWVYACLGISFIHQNDELATFVEGSPEVAAIILSCQILFWIISDLLFYALCCVCMTSIVIWAYKKTRDDARELKNIRKEINLAL